jgi:hypothetical protein
LLSAPAVLTGCGSESVDPYRDMRMLTSEELGVANRNVDPIEQAERAHNAEFVKPKKAR